MTPGSRDFRALDIVWRFWKGCDNIVNYFCLHLKTNLNVLRVGVRTIVFILIALIDDAKSDYCPRLLSFHRVVFADCCLVQAWDLCLGSVSIYGHVDKIPTCVSSLGGGGLLRKLPGDCALLSELLVVFLSLCHFLASSESFFLQNIPMEKFMVNFKLTKQIPELWL